MLKQFSFVNTVFDLTWRVIPVMLLFFFWETCYKLFETKSKGLEVTHLTPDSKTACPQQVSLSSDFSRSTLLEWVLVWIPEVNEREAKTCFPINVGTCSFETIMEILQYKFYNSIGHVLVKGSNCGGNKWSLNTYSKPSVFIYTLHNLKAKQTFSKKHAVRLIWFLCSF